MRSAFFSSDPGAAFLGSLSVSPETRRRGGLRGTWLHGPVVRCVRLLREVAQTVGGLLFFGVEACVNLGRSWAERPAEVNLWTLYLGFFLRLGCR
jgi:hypothetical protein